MPSGELNMKLTNMQLPLKRDKMREHKTGGALTLSLCGRWELQQRRDSGVARYRLHTD